MARVKNLSTGLEHEVPPGHYSLASPEYEVLAAPPAEPTKQPEDAGQSEVPVNSVAEQEAPPAEPTKAKGKK